MKSIQQGHLLRAAMMPMLAIIFSVGCYAQARAGSAGRLVGTWDAQVTLRDCGTGNAIRTFASIASFNQGGTTIGSTAGMPQAARTPEHGVWRHVKGNRYMFRFKSFNFENGVAVSYGIVTHTIELDETANSYISYGTAQFFLINGTKVGEGCSDAIGTRFEL